MGFDTGWEEVELARRVAVQISDGREAEEGLFDRISPRVRAFGFHTLRGPKTVEQFVQRVFRSLVTALRHGDILDLDKLGACVLSLARSCAKGAKPAGIQALQPRGRCCYQDTIFPLKPFIPLHKLREAESLLSRNEYLVLHQNLVARRSIGSIAEELGVRPESIRSIRYHGLTVLHGNLNPVPLQDRQAKQVFDYVCGDLCEQESLAFEARLFNGELDPEAAWIGAIVHGLCKMQRHSSPATHKTRPHHLSD